MGCHVRKMAIESGEICLKSTFDTSARLIKPRSERMPTTILLHKPRGLWAGGLRGQQSMAKKTTFLQLILIQKWVALLFLELHEHHVTWCSHTLHFRGLAGNTKNTDGKDTMRECHFLSLFLRHAYLTLISLCLASISNQSSHCRNTIFTFVSYARSGETWWRIKLKLFPCVALGSEIPPVTKAIWTSAVDLLNLIYSL